MGGNIEEGVDMAGAAMDEGTAAARRYSSGYSGRQQPLTYATTVVVRYQSDDLIAQPSAAAPSQRGVNQRG